MTDYTAPTVTKAEAAALLNCTSKSVERYAAAGKLTKFENQGPRRNEVRYLESDVLKLKDEQATATPAPRLVRPTATDQDRQTGEALQRREFFAPMLEAIAAQQALAQRQAETIERLLEPARQTKTDTALSVSDKPLLTLDECRQLTGLSRNHLLEAIHAGKLKAKIIGRAWRIKRADLDAYLRKL
jgi:excisionase family DNA binding protein